MIPGRNISPRRVLHPYGDLRCRPNPLEHQMSKRSPATAPKRARTRTAAKAAKPAVVRSPKLAAENVAAGIPAKSRKTQISSKPTDRVGNPSSPVPAAPRVEIPAAAFRAAVRAENPAAALHYDRKASATNSASNPFDFS